MKIFRIGRIGYFIYKVSFYFYRGFYFFFSILWYFPNLIRMAARDAAGNQEPEVSEGVIPPPEMDVQALDGSSHGFVFGRNLVNHRLLGKSENKDGHILIIGGSGSGKSSCYAIPQIVSWNGRVFVIDPKGELAKKAAFCRPNAKIFNPAQSDSFGYDPYYLLAESDDLAQDAFEIAMSLIPKPENVRDPFWIDGAQNLFAGAIVYFYSQGLSFIETIRKIQSTIASDLVKLLHADRDDKGEPTAAAMLVNQLASLEDKTLAGIASEMGNRIRVFATNKAVQASFSKANAITPEDLETGSDIFIVIPEDKLEQWKEIMILIFNQFMKHFERRKEREGVPILFLFEEMARVGKTEIARGLATLRDKNITIALYAQSLAQFDYLFGKVQRQIIVDNCQYKVILNATDPDTQTEFARMVGKHEKEKISVTRSVEGLLQKPTNNELRERITESKEERWIIEPDRFATLQQPVILTPFGFMRATKTPYYEMRVFKNISQLEAQQAFQGEKDPRYVEHIWS